MSHCDVQSRRRLALRAIGFALVSSPILLFVAWTCLQFAVFDRLARSVPSGPCNEPLAESEAAVVRAAIEHLSFPGDIVSVNERAGPLSFARLPSVNARFATKLSYLDNNDQPRCLMPWKDGRPILVLHVEESKLYAVEAGGKRPLQRLASSKIFYVSRAGFSADGKEAIVTVGSVCGPLCGSGYDFRLSWKNGRWEVTDQALAWVS